MQQILKTFLKRLNNLGSRNKSLLLLSLPKEQFVDLHEFDFVDGRASFQTIEQLISSQAIIPLCDVLDPRMEKVNELSKTLRKIAKTIDFIAEESGSQDLYLGYPMVQGKFLDGTVMRGPLLLFPVSLNAKPHKNGKSDKWVLQARDEAPSLNQSFLLAYSHYQQTKLDDSLLEFSIDSFDTDSMKFRTALFEFLKESALQLNFNSDLFFNQLVYFDKKTKADLELSERNGELRLMPQAVLGVFPQRGSYLSSDYEEILAKESLKTEHGNNLADLFVPDLDQNTIPKLHKEEHLLMPFEVDASQEKALKMVKNGASIVVQGPPGTGKSQLICNLVADFVARGKKVLVVSQKRAALDTVFQRLAQIKMTEFVALVHDFKNDRKVLYQQIADQIDRLDDYKTQNQSLDAIFLEREYLQTCRLIDRVQADLETFKTALFDDELYGVSAKELYLSSNPNAKFLTIKNEYKYLKINQLNDFKKRFERNAAYAQKIEKDFPFWQNRRSFEQINFTEIAQIEATLQSILAAKNLIEQQKKNWPESKKLLSQKTVFEQLQNYIQNKNQWQIWQSKQSFDFENLEKLIKQALDCHDKGIENKIDTNQLLHWQSKINQAIVQRKGLFGGVAWSFFAKDKTGILELLQQNGLDESLQDLEKLGRKISERINLQKIWELIQQRLIVPQPIGTPNAHTLQTLWHDYAQANKALDCTQNLGFQSLQSTDFEEFVLEIEAINTLNSYLENECQKWLIFLTQSQIDLLMNTTEPIEASVQTAFDFLHDADVLKASFGHAERRLIEQFDNDWHCLDNSLRLAWLQDIETQKPILRSVSSLKMSQLETELQEAVVQKQQLSQAILLLNLREQSFKNVEHNRLQNPVTYRELKHQTTKKRKIWPLRKLMATAANEVFMLQPCWMASPEAVSAIFPLNYGQSRLFDLVIFDEASQCFAQQGIPAFLRGRQVVVAGDSQQLQPNDLYQIRFEDDMEEENPTLEVDSLLGLAEQYLPQTQLKGHYRSKSLALIAFSNAHFYKNTLILLPHFKDINAETTPIHYLKVDGQWHQQSNVIEADAVVALLQELTQKHPDKSMGVVTFNQQQQALIETKLQAINLEQRSIPTFVKNIENVQGDERDIIVFSVGYAPDAKGKMAMQFGSLNQKGGENRLNVAITRAKDQVFVVASIWPDSLKVQDTLHNGPKLLKDYLAFALAVSNGLQLEVPANQNQGLANNLAQKLSNKGRPLLPFADLTVKENGQYKSLILTDDDAYFQSISVKESHAYLPINLQKKQWPFERIWSRTYWREQQANADF